jgi:hypothetical protein
MNIAINLPPEKMAKAQTLFVMSMQHACMDKCLLTYKQPTLSPGEQLCLDRCIEKYYEANDRLSARFQGTSS